MASASISLPVVLEALRPGRLRRRGLTHRVSNTTHSEIGVGVKPAEYLVLPVAG